MKKIIFLTTFLISQFTYADQLPASWTNESEIVEESALTNLDHAFDIHSEMAANLVDKDAGSKRWEMFGYVTTLGVSASGKIGLLASSGAPAVEIYWRKKAVLNKPLIDKVSLIQDTTENDISLNDETNLEESVEDVLAVVRTKKEIQITDKLKSEIRENITNLLSTSLAIESMEAAAGHGFDWYVKMLRLDLSISAEGTVATSVTAGAELVVRIFWSRTTKKTLPLKSNLVLNVTSSKFTDSVQSILENMEAINVEELTKEATKQGFALSMIRIGLGINASGQIVIGKGSGAAVMNVMFVKKPKPSVLSEKSVGLEARDLSVEDGRGNILRITKQKFVKGISKSFKLSEKIISKAARKKDRKYEPFVIWNIFSFTRGGSIGLVKVNGVGQVHLYFTKK